MLKRKPVPGHLATSAQTFGMLIKDVRETNGMTQVELAEEIPCDRSTIARIEAGTRVPQKNFVERLDEVLDTGGLFLRLWERINWYPAVDHPDWFKRRAAMDAAAVAVREYGANVVPGLLQSPNYIRALFAQTADEDGGDTEVRTQARLSRQYRFHAPDGPLLIAVLDESCVRNEIGSPAVMREQCELLLALGRQRNIVIQVAPFAATRLVAPRAPMTLITLPNRQEWVYSESLDRGHLNNDPTVFTRHLRTYDVLRADALSPEESAALIREAMEGYADDERPRPQRRRLDQEQLQREQRRQLRRSGPRLYGRRTRPRLQEPPEPGPGLPG
jgi:transcriptional regulator with XRE-family HTH domain